MLRRTALIFLLLAIITSGCTTGQAAGPKTLPTSTPFQPAGIPAAATVGDPLALPATAEPAPSATTEPTPTATPTATRSPTATPTPTPHPMSIERMRAALAAGAYPGSPITIEQELEAGANYRRYYAWYLSEGLRIYGLLTVPVTEPPEGGFPAIVFNHGYIPPSVYRTTERYIAYVDRLASSGYVVFRIDYRGHDRSEGEARGAYGDPGYAADVLNAVASLRQPGPAPVNPEKIGMWGHSMGGYLTLRAMVVDPSIKAGVIWAGVVGSYPDMLSRWRRPGPNPAPTAPSFARRWRADWVEQFGTPEQNPQFWASVSANTYVADLGGPIQLHHGTADEDVPVVFSEILAEQVTGAGKTAELHIYPGDNHNLSGYFTQAMGRTIAFYDQYLK